MFKDSLRILPVPECNDSFGDVTKLHYFCHATSALSRSCRRRVRADARRPRGRRRRQGRLYLKQDRSQLTYIRTY